MTAQITNQSAGAVAPDSALLSLTPQGLNYGGSTTVGIGTITVPPLAAYQTINLVQNITLPAVEPVPITNYTNFGLTMTQDADYVTNDLIPTSPTRESDSTRRRSRSPPARPRRPRSVRSRPGRLVGPGLEADVELGLRLPGHHRRPKPGTGAAGPFLVFFLLTGQSGSINDAIFLGETTIPGLAAGANQPLTQTLQSRPACPPG